MIDKDKELRDRIKESPTLLKLAGGEPQAVEGALVGELLNKIMGGIMVALEGLEGAGEQQALDFLNRELNGSGGATRADDTSDELRNRINQLSPDVLSDISSTDTTIDYTYNPNEGLVVRNESQAQENDEEHRQDEPGPTSGMFGP